MSWVTKATVVKRPSVYHGKYIWALSLDGTLPDYNALKYENRERDLYYGEQDGYVNFFHWQSGYNNGGFGGSNYTLTMKDGSQVVLRGPFSSRPGVMNKAGFKHCMGALFDRNGCIDITTELAQQLLDRFALPFKIESIVHNGEISYYLQSKDGREGADWSEERYV